MKYAIKECAAALLIFLCTLIAIIVTLLAIGIFVANAEATDERRFELCAKYEVPVADCRDFFAGRGGS